MLCKQSGVSSILTVSTIDKGYLERLVAFFKKAVVVKKSSTLMGYRSGPTGARLCPADVES